MNSNQEDFLAGLDVQQHSKKFILEILEEYPQVRDKLARVREHIDSIYIGGYDHALTEPDLVLSGSDALIRVNK